MKDDILEIVNENGEVKKYNILFKFDELDNNKHYVVYTDYTKNEKGNINIHSNTYSNENGEFKLSEIDDMEVKTYINKKLKSLVRI